MNNVFSIMERTLAEEPLQQTNSIDENIRFSISIERESNHQLPFLDISVKTDEQLRTAFFRKPTYTNQVLNLQSSHSRSAKSWVVWSMMD